MQKPVFIRDIRPSDQPYASTLHIYTLIVLLEHDEQHLFQQQLDAHGAAWPAAQPQMSKSPRGPSGRWHRCPPRSWRPPTCPRRQPAALTNIPPRRHHDSARLPCQRVDQHFRTPPGAQTLMREGASARRSRPAFVRDSKDVLSPTECGHRALRDRCGR